MASIDATPEAQLRLLAWQVRVLHEKLDTQRAQYETRLKEEQERTATVRADRNDEWRSARAYADAAAAARKENDALRLLAEAHGWSVPREYVMDRVRSELATLVNKDAKTSQVYKELEQTHKATLAETVHLRKQVSSLEEQLRNSDADALDAARKRSEELDSENKRLRTNLQRLSQSLRSVREISGGLITEAVTAQDGYLGGRPQELRDGIQAAVNGKPSPSGVDLVSRPLDDLEID